MDEFFHIDVIFQRKKSVALEIVWMVCRRNLFCGSLAASGLRCSTFAEGLPPLASGVWLSRKERRLWPPMFDCRERSAAFGLRCL